MRCTEMLNEIRKLLAAALASDFVILQSYFDFLRTRLNHFIVYLCSGLGLNMSRVKILQMELIKNELFAKRALHSREGVDATELSWVFKSNLESPLAFRLLAVGS